MASLPPRMRLPRARVWHGGTVAMNGDGRSPDCVDLQATRSLPGGVTALLGAVSWAGDAACAANRLPQAERRPPCAGAPPSGSGSSPKASPGVLPCRVQGRLTAVQGRV